MLYKWHNGKIVDTYGREVKFATGYEHNDADEPQPAPADETKTAQGGKDKAE